MDQDATWYGARPRSRRHCVRLGPLPQKGAEPDASLIFGPCLLWPNGWTDQDGTWHGGGPWSRPHCARWGPSSPPQKADRAPSIFWPFYCDQTAGCIKMPLHMEVGLSPGDFVLDRDPAHRPTKGRSPPIFGPRLLWPNGCMDQDATWFGSRPRPTRHCVRWEPAPPPLKGHLPPQFSAIVRCGQMAGWT